MNFTLILLPSDTNFEGYILYAYSADCGPYTNNYYLWSEVHQWEVTQHGEFLVLPACDKRQILLSVASMTAMGIFEKFWCCLLLFALCYHNTACFFLLKENPCIWVRTQFHKDRNLAIISKEIRKAEQRHSLELVPLRCYFRQFSSWGAGQEPERWVTCQEVRQEAITGLPSWFRVPCSPCCSSSWDTALVGQKSTTGQFIPALCVCAARIPQKHKALRNPGLCQCMGEKNADTWNGRRGVCLEKQTERLGSFQEAAPGLLTCSPGCQIALQEPMVAAGAANRYSSWLYSPATHKRGTRSCL